MRTNPLFFAALLVTTEVTISAEPLWELELDGPVVGTPASAGDALIIGAGSDTYRIDHSGQIIWQTAVSGKVLASVVTDENGLYTHTTAGLFALDHAGNKRWQYLDEDRGALVAGATMGWGDGVRSDPWVFYRSSPLLADGKVIFGNSAGVRALDARTGEPRWHRELASVTHDIQQTGELIIAGDWSNQLHALTIADGAPSWSFAARLPGGQYADWEGWKGLHVTPMVVDDSIFVGSRGTYFYKLAAANGSEVWSTKAATSWIGSAAAATDSTVYYGLSDGKALIGLDRNTGNQQLLIPTPDAVFATPVITKDLLIAGTINGQLLIVDLAAGELKQTVSLHDDARTYGDFFRLDPGSEQSIYDQTAAILEAMKATLHSILSLKIDAGLLLVGTGSGRLMAYRIDDLRD